MSNEPLPTKLSEFKKNQTIYLFRKINLKIDVICTILAIVFLAQCRLQCVKTCQFFVTPSIRLTRQKECPRASICLAHLRCTSQASIKPNGNAGLFRMKENAHFSHYVKPILFFHIKHLLCNTRQNEMEAGEWLQGHSVEWYKLMNKLQWNFNKNTKIFVLKNLFQNVLVKALAAFIGIFLYWPYIYGN